MRGEESSLDSPESAGSAGAWGGGGGEAARVRQGAGEEIRQPAEGRGTQRGPGEGGGEERTLPPHLDRAVFQDLQTLVLALQCRHTRFSRYSCGIKVSNVNFTTMPGT